MTRPSFTAAIAGALMLLLGSPAALAQAPKAGPSDPEIVYFDWSFMNSPGAVPCRLMVCNGDGSGQAAIASDFEEACLVRWPRMAPDRRNVVYELAGEDEEQGVAVRRTRFDVVDGVVQVLGTETLIAGSAKHLGRLALSSDGSKLAYYDVRAKALMEYSFATGKSKAAYKSPKNRPFVMVGGYSGDGNTLFFTEQRPKRAVDIRRIKFLGRGRVSVTTVKSLPWSQYVVFVEPAKTRNELAIYYEVPGTGGRSTVSILDLGDRTVEEIPELENARYPVWSPDDWTMAFVDGGRTLRTIEVFSRAVTRLVDQIEWFDWR